MWLASVSVVAWIGHLLVKILTLGKIDLGWRPCDDESVASQWIGFFVLMVIAGAGGDDRSQMKSNSWRTERADEVFATFGFPCRRVGDRLCWATDEMPCISA
jgi:hypothetical protein